MNEQNQAALLEAYISACRQNADAPVPDGLDPEMAAFVRQLMRHKPAQDERTADQRPLDERPLRERIWANALTAANAAPHAPTPAKPGNPTFSPNGHHKTVEKAMLLSEAEPITVLPVPASMRLPRRAITSPSLLTVAATLALVFLGVLMMMRLNNGDGDQFGAGILQNETPTPTETPTYAPESTMPPTFAPTSTPFRFEVIPLTSTPFPTIIIRMPPTLPPTIPFSGDTRPQPCIPTEVPTIVPPDWPTATATPVGMEPTPLPMDAAPIDCLMPTPIPICQVVVISQDGVQLRSRAAEESALLMLAPFGQPMTVILQETGIDDGREWYLVEFDIDGIRVMGYVREDHVQVQSGSICPPPTPTPIPLTVLPPTLTRPVTDTPTAFPPTLVRPMTSTPTAFLSTREATPTPTPLR